MANFIMQLAPTWPGFSGIKNLVVFGDSYSSVGGYGLEETPTPQQPLGVHFPGVTYNEPDQANWVGHLLTSHCPPPRFNPHSSEQESGYEKSAILVYDYAAGGQTVYGMKGQVQEKFLPQVLGKSDSESHDYSVNSVWNPRKVSSGPRINKERPWDPVNALFVTWIGINDCGMGLDISQAQETLFLLQEKLYSAGARHFLFIDVPPVHRSPATPDDADPRCKSWSARIYAWNSSLSLLVQSFARDHTDATVLVFSSFSVFSDILDDPEKYGFNPDDRRKACGGMWTDHLHPTSGMHAIVSERIAQFLGSIV